MILLPLQWEKHMGPDAVGQHKLVFTMDESVNYGNFNPLTIKKGTQFLVMMIEASTKEADEFVQETPDQTRERLWKRFHALITEVSTIEKTSPDTLKDSIRTTLITEGQIKESTKELTMEQLSAEIIRLTKYKNEIEHHN